jgi:hypothetical protein
MRLLLVFQKNHEESFPHLEHIIEVIRGEVNVVAVVSGVHADFVVEWPRGKIQTLFCQTEEELVQYLMRILFHLEIENPDAQLFCESFQAMIPHKKDLSMFAHSLSLLVVRHRLEPMDGCAAVIMFGDHFDLRIYSTLWVVRQGPMEKYWIGRRDLTAEAFSTLLIENGFLDRTVL